MGIRGQGLMMKICVQGLWHLGAVTAACLTKVGHDVVGLGPDQSVVNALNQGKAPLFEPGLDDLLQEGIAKQRLYFTTNIAEAASDAEVLWVAFDTPVDDEDHADVEYVITQIKSVLPVLADGAVILVSSQMPVGSIRKLEAFVRKKLPNKSFSLACSPENLRLGKALDVFLKPDRIVVGVRTEATRTKLK
jgi:UDPglucose 6-dehydrogenase